MIERILNLIELATGLKPIPVYAPVAQKCVVYKYYKTSQFHYRLDIRAMASTFAEVDELANAIDEALQDVGDKEALQNISITLNGGGTLFDYENNLHHRILYYDVVSKRWK